MKRMTIITVIAFHLFSILQVAPAIAQPGLTIVHQPVEEASLNEAILLQAKLEGQVSGKIVYIMYRKTGKKHFSSVSMASAGDNAFQGEIPAKAVTEVGIDYYLRVLDPAGSQLARFPEGDGFIAVSILSPQPVAPEPATPEAPPAAPPPLPISLPVGMEEAETTPAEEEVTAPAIAEPLRILHQPVTEATVGEALELMAELTKTTPGGIVYIMYRQVGQNDFHSQIMPALVDLTFSGEIPGDAITSAGMEYYLQVLNSIGTQLARYPEDNSFVTILVPILKLIEETTSVEETPPIAEEKPQIIPEEPQKTGGLQTWHWVGLGGLVVAGVAALALSGGDGDGDGDGGSSFEKLPDPPDRP